MATFTAQGLIGRSHPNHDGIFPTHALMVSENSRAALVLVPFKGFDKDEPVPDGAAPRRIVWIPDPQHVVDDLILQVCIHVLHQTAVTEQAEAIVAGLSTADYADLSDLSPADRKVLSTVCRGVEGFPKLVVTLLAGSLLTGNITRFGEYAMDIEICPVAYQRQYSAWNERTHIAGDLAEIGSL